MSLLEVRDLNVSFRQDGKTTHAVRGVSFTLERGQTVALVGESGSGTSVTAWYRSGADRDWSDLGTRSDASTDDVILGAKIWSKVRCGGLTCDLSDLSVSAEVPADQFPELEPRPDPRQS